MLRGLYTAWTGMVNEQNRMDILTNNLANVSTVGYKKEGSTSQAFDDVLTVKIKDASVGLSNVQRTGIRNPGVKIGENYVDFSGGSFRETGNIYDLALDGDGFFAIEFAYKNSQGNNVNNNSTANNNNANTQRTTMYTRAGQFTLTRDGYLVNQDGDYVLDVQNRRIQLNTLVDSVITTDGTISQNGRAVAQIQVADFEDYDYLEKYGETYFRPLEGARLRNGGGTATVNSGYLEMANVQAVSEMVNLIAITRAYEANQKIIQTYDDSLQIAVTQLGRLS
ncbi:MAG: flagellar hook-basal body protein [Acetatifactor sp.]|nr:flagellar hook-basal body protein [Acetatifactor sp.]